MVFIWCIWYYLFLVGTFGSIRVQYIFDCFPSTKSPLKFFIHSFICFVKPFQKIFRHCTSAAICGCWTFWSCRTRISSQIWAHQKAPANNHSKFNKLAILIQKLYKIKAKKKNALLPREYQALLCNKRYLQGWLLTCLNSAMIDSEWCGLLQSEWSRLPLLSGFFYSY